MKKSKIETEIEINSIEDRIANEISLDAANWISNLIDLKVEKLVNKKLIAIAKKVSKLKITKEFDWYTSEKDCEPDFDSFIRELSEAINNEIYTDDSEEE